MSKLESIIATGNRGWQAGPGQLMPNDLRVYGYVPVEMVRALVAAHGGEAS